ncbi:MAG: YraN family protein [Bacteroidia bacterium]|jgi:putative endonuclease|nr:YraN family protein [Bacteroidales bacterium]MDD3300470.1 YraN family protein [Bacteroidales bacterium]MDD3844419.1 YraN family protein [Bacteroidales bacterium]MDD4618378.1 YraN family protein [Bacteroidales bacterium]NCC46323.1 YraN family protein [Bacteroidia bacterium]
MNDKGQKGRIAEEIALGFLIDRGLVLLDRNWRWGHRELDLVMKGGCSYGKKDVLHIVEVRSLYEPCCQMPVETVDKKKRRMVISAASGYIKVHGIDFETRFDIVSVLFSTDGTYKLEYYPDAFSPEW